MAALLQAEVPSSKGFIDPVGDLLAAAKAYSRSESKYDPVPVLLNAEPQQRGENDPLGNFIRGVTNADLRGVPGRASYQWRTHLMIFPQQGYMLVLLFYLDFFMM